MSLYTRCPDCSTVFRVVADQLRISEGWVRCGQCAAVFQGHEHLLMTQVLSPSSPTAAGVAEPTTRGDDPAADVCAGEVSSVQESSGFVEPDWVQSPQMPMSDEVAMLASSARMNTQQVEVNALTGGDHVQPRDIAGAASTHVEAHAGAVASVPVTDALLSISPHPFAGWDGFASDESPAFVRRAHRIAFWSSARMRFAVGSTLLMALLILFLQWAWFDRDRLAARWPGLNSPLTVLCSMAGCELAAPRAIESLVLDSSSFLRVRGDVFRLTFLLRHNAQHAIKTPHVELTLTDMDDQPIMRSVWAPNELSPQAPSAIGVGESWSASTLLAVEAASRVAGYRLLTFYP
jgi:predicted Zn finger-like uncharacterized protein